MFSQLLPLPVMHWAILPFPPHLPAREEHAPFHSQAFSPCQKAPVGPRMFFPREKVGNDAGAYPAHTQVPPLKLSAVLAPGTQCGAAPCGDRGGIFCICCGHCLPVRVAQCPRGSLLAHGASWGDGWPETSITPSLVLQCSCTWPCLQNKLACLCSHMLPSLSPLQMARAKPTIALRPPPSNKSSLPAGENPEHIFLEIIFPRDGQPKAGCRHGVWWYKNQLGRTAHQREREKENHTGCQTPLPGWAAPWHF